MRPMPKWAHAMRPYVKMTSAKDKALAYLNRFARTEKQVAQYLSRKGFPQEEIAQTIVYLREHRFLNDDVFAESYIQSRIRHCDGPFKIKQLLLQKGISPDIADHLLKQSYPDDLQQEKIASLVKKRLKGTKRVSRIERERVFRFIASRGFSRYVIIQVFNRL